MDAVRIAERVGFVEGKMAKHALLATARCQLDLYCLYPGQSQNPHAHPDQDKVYYGVEGVGRIRVGPEERSLEPGTAVLAPAGVEHGLANDGSDPLVVLVFLAPPPRH